ncbi:MAG: hypothetical protein FWF87_08875 [Synergistaceae bacterium]|nr:hypothetical protein [Synergistaceae bacterium]
MKKIILLSVVIFMLSFSCAAMKANAGDLADGNVSLGQDHVKMTWYLISYGKTDDTGAPLGVVRKYYTNAGIKDETIELLMSKFGIDAARASSLYFTEYVYNYSADHKKFAVGYIRHYDMEGTVIHGTDFNAPTELTWVNVDSKGPSGLALNAIRKAGNIPDPSKKKK